MASRLKQIPESTLAKLWKERTSREASLKSKNGRRFRVIYPGRASTSAGPDFREAVFEEEGVGLVRGDVEVHVKQRGWDAHGHGKDPRYNGVVLHVVAELESASTTLQSGSQVPVLSLQPLLQGRPCSGDGPGIWPLLESHGYVPPKGPTELGQMLDNAGDARFTRKCSSFNTLLQEEEPHQVLYEALMEALGYSQNREPFLELAHRVPYRLVSEVAIEAPPEERVTRIQGLLLRAAGFSLSDSPTSRLDRRENTSVNPGRYECGGEAPNPTRGAPMHRRGQPGPSPCRQPSAAGSGGAKVMPRGRWHLFRIRPQNHPRVRIMGFARMLNVFLPSKEDTDSGCTAGNGRAPHPLAPGIPGPVGAEGPTQPRIDASPIMGSGSDLTSWAQTGLVEGIRRLILASTSSPEGKCAWRDLEMGLVGGCGPADDSSGSDHYGNWEVVIGKGRARDMVVNCALPFLHALARIEGDNELAELCSRIFHSYPKLQENELTREMRQQLLSQPLRAKGTGPGDGGTEDWQWVVSSARRQQGLIHLHHLITSPAAPRVEDPVGSSVS